MRGLAGREDIALCASGGRALEATEARVPLSSSRPAQAASTLNCVSPNSYGRVLTPRPQHGL